MLTTTWMLSNPVYCGCIVIQQALSIHELTHDVNFYILCVYLSDKTVCDKYSTKHQQKVKYMQ
jgi:hypothetical protein